MKGLKDGTIHKTETGLVKLGISSNPQFGPCVMVGFGGVMTEILNDSVFGVAPLTHTQALEVIDRLKTQKFLNGFRGAGVVDR